MLLKPTPSQDTDCAHPLHQQIRVPRPVPPRSCHLPSCHLMQDVCTCPLSPQTAVETPSQAPGFSQLQYSGRELRSELPERGAQVRGEQSGRPEHAERITRARRERCSRGQEGPELPSQEGGLCYGWKEARPGPWTEAFSARSGPWVQPTLDFPGETQVPISTRACVQQGRTLAPPHSQTRMGSSRRRRKGSPTSRMRQEVVDKSPTL